MSALPPGATIRNPGEGDEAQMVELLCRVFQQWPAFESPVPPVEHLRWKMRSDPIAVRHHYVSEFDQRIVAMLLRIVRRIRVRGRDYLAREGADAAVDPGFQEQGLFAAMVGRAESDPRDREFDLSLDYSTNPRIRHRGTRRERKALANRLQVLQKPYRARAIVARARQKGGGRLPAPLAVLRLKLGTALNRLGHRPYWRRAEMAGSLTTVERFDERIDAFFEAAARPFEAVVVRCKDYLNWRYCDPASGRFTIRVAEQEGRILGYLVFKISRGSGYIADLLALPDRTDVVRSLVEDALRILRQARVESVICWMISRHPYNGILRRYGFVDSRRDVGLTYRTIGLDSTSLAFLADAGARIHLTHGDSDWI